MWKLSSLLLLCINQRGQLSIAHSFQWIRMKFLPQSMGTPSQGRGTEQSILSGGAKREEWPSFSVYLSFSSFPFQLSTPSLHASSSLFSLALIFFVLSSASCFSIPLSSYFFFPPISLLPGKNHKLFKLQGKEENNPPPRPRRKEPSFFQAHTVVLGIGHWLPKHRICAGSSLGQNMSAFFLINCKENIFSLSTV